MKQIVFIILGIFVFIPKVIGNDFVLSGYTELGKRSTAEDYEEEDEDNDYSYKNYHLKLKQKLSDRLAYDIGSFVYDKDYNSKDSLDNISKIFKTKFSSYLKKLEEESLKLDFRLKYKEKRYENTPASEYNQIMFSPSFTFKKKNRYSVNLTAGINDFDYLEADHKNQLKFFSEIGVKRYILQKKLKLSSSYKIEIAEKKSIGRRRTKHDIKGGFDYILDLPWVYKITTQTGWGQRDTKDEDERDEDYDYKYQRRYIKTEHKIIKKLKTDLKYQYFKKDYLVSDLDHPGFYIKNSWEYKIFNDKDNKVDLRFSGENKEVKYSLKPDNNYYKKMLEIKTAYLRKKNYKTSLSWQGNFYDYNKSSKDKKRYYVKLSGQKFFSEGDLVLSLDFKYRYTDWEQKDDLEEEAVRVAFKCKF
jgi:hypothetical protein